MHFVTVFTRLKCCCLNSNVFVWSYKYSRPITFREVAKVAKFTKWSTHEKYRFGSMWVGLGRGLWKWTHGQLWTTVIFHDFPGLENSFRKSHDFPRCRKPCIWQASGVMHTGDDSRQSKHKVCLVIATKRRHISVREQLGVGFHRCWYHLNEFIHLHLHTNIYEQLRSV